MTKEKMGAIVTKNKKDTFHKGYRVFNLGFKDGRHKRGKGESQQRKDMSKGKEVNTVRLY